MNTFPSSRSHGGFGLLEVILVFALLLGAGAILFYVAQRAELTAHSDSDRALVAAIAIDISISYPKAGWPMDSGPENTFSDSPQVFAGNACALDSWGMPGCLSSLTGQSITVGAEGGGGFSSISPDEGTAYYVSLEGASQDDCNSFLAGGPAALGGIAAFTDYNPYSGPTGMHSLKTGGEVSDFCQAASDADGGTIQFLNVVYGNASNMPSTIQ